MRSIAALVLLAPLVVATSAETLKLEEQCTISFKGNAFSRGPCAVTVENEPLTKFKAKLADSGFAHLVVADDKKATATALGAGTFVLATGPVEAGAWAAANCWPKGHAIDTTLSSGK